jgi:hypothetical protein
MSFANVNQSRVTFTCSDPVSDLPVVAKSIFSHIKISDTQVKIAIVAAVAFLALAGLLAATALTGGLAAVPLALIGATAGAGIINVPLITIVFVNAFYDRKDESALLTVSRDQRTRKREPSPQFRSHIQELIAKGEADAAAIRVKEAAEFAARCRFIEGNPADAPHRLF